VDTCLLIRDAEGTLPRKAVPFDRILIAQARVEGVSLLTADETVSRYGGKIIYTP
jgi:PIN domain nuclease of toxin-antitoxin system